jgi:hypothetical protein
LRSDNDYDTQFVIKLHDVMNKNTFKLHPNNFMTFLSPLCVGLTTY